MRFYARLAVAGIRKNKRLYVPFLLTCIGMVLMFFLISFLCYDPLLSEMRGGTSLGIILRLAQFVIAIFALIFLFYTNSFLMRRRNREFGLYNVLGMSKRNIARLLVWETLFIFALSLLIGTALGVVLSKLAELGLMKLLRQTAVLTFAMSVEPFLWTVGIFAAIFLLLLGKALLQLWRTDTLKLLHSENLGERPPKANWVGALLGAVLLGAAYWLAVSIEEPITAIAWFFVAVIMVIAATYFLLISGSVVLCRILQRNKRYYYQPNHFVSVSSMTYRMKRNGAGLASICILSTMVLVMISSTASLYLGVEDMLTDRYGNDITATISLSEPQSYDSERFSALTGEILEAYREQQPENVVTGRYFIADFPYDGEVFGGEGRQEGIIFLPIEDYNALLGTQLTLGPDEALASSTLGADRLIFGELPPLHVTGTAGEVPLFVSDTLSRNACVVLGDFDGFLARLLTAIEDGTVTASDSNGAWWKIGFDLANPTMKPGKVIQPLSDVLRDWDDRCWNGYGLSSLSENRMDFYAAYGGLFFIGILLSIVFILAAVLIIYYKQVSEGYEDQMRFAVMQKVGMSKRLIRKSINSQILLVFFLPLLLAGLHLAFAFPLVWRVLQLFELSNLKLLIFVTLGAYLVFALLYTLVYRLTSNAYFGIVSGSKNT